MRKKNRNLVAKDLLTSGLYKTKAEKLKKAYKRNQKHKGNTHDL